MTNHPFGNKALANNFLWLYESLNDEKANYRWISLRGGSNGSKSWSCLQNMLILAVLSKVDILCCAKSIPSLKTGLWKDVKNILADSKPIREQIETVHQSDRYLLFKNGSRILFKAYADEDSAKGGKNDYLYIDEINTIDRKIIDQLASRTAYKIIASYNPSHPFWFNEIESQHNCNVIYSNYKDNPHCPKAIIDHLEGFKDTNPTFYKVYCLGLQGSIDNLVFHKWEKLSLEEFRALENCEFECLGVDLGYTDETSVCHVKIRKKCLYIHQVVYAPKLLNSEIGELIKNYIALEGLKLDILISCDSAEPKSIEQLKRLGLNIKGVKKGNSSVNFGVSYMKEFEIFITSCSNNVIDEFKIYRTNDKGKFVGSHHSIDAIRYGVLYSNKKHSGKGVRWITPNHYVKTRLKQIGGYN